MGYLEMNEEVNIALSTKEVSVDAFECPRCAAFLIAKYEEYLCIQCGYVDYNLEPERRQKSQRNALNAATLWVVRYSGDSSSLENTIMHVTTERRGYCTFFSVTCPYCEKPMTQSSIRSSRKIEFREERHKCSSGHIIKLNWDEDAELSWC